MHHIILWKWKQDTSAHSYGADQVNVICEMIKRHTATLKCRVLCLTDDPRGITECATFPIWRDASQLANASGVQLPSCYRRLKLYDPATQKLLGIRKGDRIVSLDLDTVIVGNIDNILLTDGLFVGWELRGTYHPVVYNGSFQMFTAGMLDNIWKDFEPNRSPKVAADAGYRGSDQAWLSYNMVGKPGVVGLRYPEVSSYPLNNKISGQVDYRTRIVFFHGPQKPWYDSTFAASSWVKENWTAAQRRIQDAASAIV